MYKATSAVAHGFTLDPLHDLWLKQGSISISERFLIYHSVIMHSIIASNQKVK